MARRMSDVLALTARQADDDRGAGAELACNRQGSAKSLGQALADRQSQSRPLGAARQALIAVNQRVPGTIAVAAASSRPLAGGAVVMLDFHMATGATNPAVKFVRAMVSGR